MSNLGVTIITVNLSDAIKCKSTSKMTIMSLAAVGRNWFNPATAIVTLVVLSTKPMVR